MKKPHLIKPVFFLLIIGIVVLLGLMFGYTNQAAEAAETVQILERARDQVAEAKPGELVHLQYARFTRMPPPELEPTDPYHLPYLRLWHEKELVETWIEIGEDGMLTRWRTQLRSSDGELLQDLLFDNGIETDYFPLEHKAYQFSQEGGLYRDEELVLIEDFLTNDKLSKRQNSDLNGRSVVSVYTPAEDVATNSTRAEALVYQQRPFKADLDAVSRSNRIDFDVTTLLPVGEAQVVWDKSGQEHVIAYRSLEIKETLPSAKAEEVFNQQIPEEAFQDSFSLPVGASISGLDNIMEHVDYPIYILAESDSLNLVDANLNLSAQPKISPTLVDGIASTSALELAVKTVYKDASQGIDTEKAFTIAIVQGAKTDMEFALSQTRPAWFQAAPKQLQLEDQTVTVWVMTGLEDTHWRYVIEAPADTILYVDSQGLPEEQSWQVLHSLAPIQQP